jgi:molybdenum cofactor cytidylyltransferase
VSIPAIILAAGASTRMGSPKQLVLWDGETMLHRTARMASEAGCDPVIVVIGYEAKSMHAAVADLPVCCITNLDWKEGMASSLRAGVTALPTQAEATLLLVCDQPSLDTALLRSMLTAHHSQRGTMVACTYGDTRGIPAILPRRCFDELLRLRGDRGAKAMLEGEKVIEVAFPGGALDLDKPEDLAKR